MAIKIWPIFCYYIINSKGGLEMINEKTNQLAKTALMIALIFVGTFSIRIPNPATGGYFHMGDSMIFLSVLILGKRDGAFAGALGGALADLLCGAAIWIGSTLIIKFIMAWIMGIIWEQYPSKIISAIGGGVFQIIAYTATETFLFTWPAALGALPGLTMQTAGGIIIYVILARALQTTKLLNSD